MVRVNDLETRLLRELSRGDTRLFRNTIGEGWMGKTARREGDLILLQNARHVTFGLCVGSSDHIGWTSVVIGPEHIGQRFARFVAIEAKDGTGRTTADQRNFISRVVECGGLAGVARNVGQARHILGLPPA